MILMSSMHCMVDFTRASLCHAMNLRPHPQTQFVAVITVCKSFGNHFGWFLKILNTLSIFKMNMLFSLKYQYFEVV